MRALPVNQVENRDLFCNRLGKRVDESGFINMRYRTRDGSELPITSFYESRDGLTHAFLRAKNPRGCPWVMSTFTGSKRCSRNSRNG